MKKLIVILGFLACSAFAQEVPIVIIKAAPTGAPGTPVVKQWWRQAVTADKLYGLQESPGGVNSTLTRTGANTNPQPNALVITPCPLGQVESGGVCACPSGTAWNAGTSTCSPASCPVVTGSASVSPASLTSTETAYWNWGFSGGTISSVVRTCSGVTNVGATSMALAGTNVAWGAAGFGIGTTDCVFTATNTCGSSTSRTASVTVTNPACTITCPAATTWNGTQCTGSATNCVGNPTTTQGYTWYNLNPTFTGSATCPQTGSGVVAAVCGSCPATQTWNGSACAAVACTVDCVAATGWGSAYWNAGTGTCDRPTSTCASNYTLTATGVNYWNINTAAAGPGTCPASTGEQTRSNPTCTPNPPVLTKWVAVFGYWNTPNQVSGACTSYASGSWQLNCVYDSVGNAGYGLPGALGCYGFRPWLEPDPGFPPSVAASGYVRSGNSALNAMENSTGFTLGQSANYINAGQDSGYSCDSQFDIWYQVF